ncbi:MAG: hypothetical protein K0R65_2107 [Crocinitomicaceae bacterium]|jgi:hypothetical protein|nr:hypothetical protein [Crocinitomicaceae bacterium]
MKNPALLLLTGILALIFISSCIIEKRRVNKGYFVQWSWGKKNSSFPAPSEKSHHLTDEATLEIYESLVSIQQEGADAEAQTFPMEIN